MNIKIYESDYKNQKAINIESNLIKVQFLPEIGSKMSNFIYKPLDLDLLIHRSNKKYRLGIYDGDYLKSECSGFDEMFPSINKCYYDAYPWSGIKIPDHGEVWSLNWDLKLEKSKIIMDVNGVRFPYKIKKIIYFLQDNILRIEYELVNTSNFNFYFLWSAHFMFVSEEGLEIILPQGVNKIVSVFSHSSRLGNYGDEFSWPKFQNNKGKDETLNIIRPKSTRDYGKYYIKGKIPEGWCVLKYPKSNILLALSFPEEKVPYLAILPNEGGWDNFYNIFIEPCTSSFDRLDVAKLRGECSCIPAKSKTQWYLNLTVSDLENFKSINDHGILI